MQLKIFKKSLLFSNKNSKPNERSGGNVFIWGVVSKDNFTNSAASESTLNDIAVYYNQENKVFILDLETIYCFSNRSDEINYLEHLLKEFTYFMEIKQYNTKCNFSLLNIDFTNLFVDKTIEELYIKFKIFVEGYKVVTEQLNENKGVVQ